MEHVQKRVLLRSLTPTQRSALRHTHPVIPVTPSPVSSQTPHLTWPGCSALQPGDLPVVPRDRTRTHPRTHQRGLLDPVDETLRIEGLGLGVHILGPTDRASVVPDGPWGTRVTADYRHPSELRSQAVSEPSAGSQVKQSRRLMRIGERSKKHDYQERLNSLIAHPRYVPLQRPIWSLNLSWYVWSN